MQKDPDNFLSMQISTGETPFTSIINLISKIVSDLRESEDYILHKTWVELIISLLENLHTKIDDSISSIMELLITEIQRSEDKLIKFTLTQALSSWFVYNPTLSFKIAEENGWTQGIFELWITELPNAKFEIEIKRLILGLVSIISCPSSQIPEMLIQEMSRIYKDLAILCQKSLIFRQSNNKNNKQKQEEEEIKAYNLLDDWSDEEDLDDDEDYDPDDEYRKDDLEFYKSSIQDVDEIFEVKKALSSLDAQTYNNYFKDVTADDQHLMSESINNPHVIG